MCVCYDIFGVEQIETKCKMYDTKVLLRYCVEIKMNHSIIVGPFWWNRYQQMWTWTLQFSIKCVSYVPKPIKMFGIPLKNCWNFHQSNELDLKLFHFHHTRKNRCIFWGKQFCTSQLSSNWMTILKICMFTPLNAGGFISASFSIFMPCRAWKWWHLLGETSDACTLYAILERNSTHTTYEYMWQDEREKIGKRNTCFSHAHQLHFGFIVV